MKKIFAILSVFLIFSSCGKLEDLNVNTKDPGAVSGESLFTNAQKELFDQMVTPNVNLNIYRLIMQQWTEVTYIDESNYDLDTRSIPDNQWDIIYRDVIKDLDESKKVITTTTYLPSESPLVKQNKLAIVDIMSVYAYSILVETFGDIPYSEALNSGILLPKYDDGLTVYKDLIARLNTDLGILDASQGSFGQADNMYQGTVANWIKFANSLKLKMGMVLSDVDDAFAKTTVESAAPGVFASNDDNAELIYLSASPNTNPVNVELVASFRNDFIPTSTIVDYMNTLEDPRRPLYFTQTDTSTVSGEVKLAYYGGVNGLGNEYAAFSHVSDAMKVTTFPGMIFDYAEVEFLLANAYEKGYSVGGTAEEHYNKGVTASILYWGGSDADAATYLSNPGVAYATATGTYQEKIGMQMWLALYNNGFHAWTEWRRLDFPQLEAPEDAVSVTPVRYTFPTSEQTLNKANYDAASSHIGGDDVGTHLFWDLF